MKEIGALLIILIGKTEGNSHLGELVAYRKILLKLILCRLDESVQTGFFGLGLIPRVSTCEQGNLHLQLPIKGGQFADYLGDC
jgi:hypothetical protein